MDSFAFDVAAGLALGSAIAYVMWLRPADKSGHNVPLRNFSADELKLYEGKGQGVCYVSVRGRVYDVTSVKPLFQGTGKYAMLAGKNTNDACEWLTSKYKQVGTLTLPRSFTLDELKPNDGTNGHKLFLAVKGVVFDVSRGANFYGVGGAYGFLAGRDATRALALMSFDTKEVENATIEGLSNSELETMQDWLAKFKLKYPIVGYVVVNGNPQYADSQDGLADCDVKMPGEGSKSKRGSKTKAKAVVASGNFLNKKRQTVKLAEKIDITHDTRLFRFALPAEDMALGLPTGKHIKIYGPRLKAVVEGEWNGRADPEATREEVERKYTPSSSNDDLGHFDIVIKVYQAGVIERFPDGGKMSRWLDTLTVGDTMDIAGPFGLVEYKGNSALSVKRKERTVNHIGMMSGGTGITPMLQLIAAILKDPKDKTKLSLLFANQSEDDILVREMLEKLQKSNPKQFKLWYTVDRPTDGWKYSTGFISEAMIKEHMPKPADGTVVLMCGPPPMVKFACKANLDKLGYAKEDQIEF